MHHALIRDNSNYVICKLITEENKYCVVKNVDFANNLLNKKTYLSNNSNLNFEKNGVEKKIKSENLIIKFDKVFSEIEQLVHNLQQNIDLDLLWELTDERQTWTWDELVNLYFNTTALEHKLALFLKVTTPEIHFIYQGLNNFKRANTQEITAQKLKLQLAHEYEIRFNLLYSKLINLQIPDWQIEVYSLLNHPDKNSIEYKVLFKVARELKLTIPELIFKLGYINSIDELLINNFKKNYFNQNHTTLPVKLKPFDESIILNDKLDVFSIDDSFTTEIDDAFSVQKLDNGWIIGIHIAAPALDQQLLEIASDRISTVYYPGNKITMLPDNVITHYSLVQGKQLPVVSIYFELDQDLIIKAQQTRLEQVLVKQNLRIEDLETLFNSENLAIDHGYAYEQELKLLYKFAVILEGTRGRPSVNQLNIDYSFAFDNNQVIIKPRIRGNPIDKLVSELMILGNCSWGRMLTNAFIPAIYRVKQPMSPVHMTTTPNSHVGLNVDYYTWASSPLRRSIDLINQTQIINLITNSKPLSSIDHMLSHVVTTFDQTYSAYLKFQDSLERYWSLRYLEQQQIQEIDATFVYKNIVQLTGVPISLDISNITKAKPPGTTIKLVISNFNFINQTMDFKLLEI